jgi:hypothetical protein
MKKTSIKSSVVDGELNLELHKTDATLLAINSRLELGFTVEESLTLPPRTKRSSNESE